MMTAGSRPDADAAWIRGRFDRALELPPALRKVFLDQACASDPRLGARLRSLVALAAEASGFLEPPSLPEPNLEPGDQVGPYRIDRLLGRGGGGAVYRAYRDGEGAAVALKTVTRVRSALIASLRREIDALVRLRHPGIVAIHEHGLHGGLPWYAMDLVEGRSLCEFLPSAEADGSGESRTGSAATPSDAPLPARPACPADLPRLLAIARRLCFPLAWLHGQGIVHRDLKPANVLVRDGDQPVLMDFGLAATTGGHEALDADGGAAGTLCYVAPEQAAGDEVDARADLFALGCILYEMATRRRAFPARTWTELRDRHAEPPPPPTTIMDGLPAGLDELVMGLLARNPRERRGHCIDVAAALGAMGGTADDCPSAPAPREVLYRARLSGRDGAMAQLDGELAQLASGHGALVAIRGDAGAGKTRLLNEVVRRARQHDFEILTGTCQTALVGGGGVGPPLQALRPVLRTIAEWCHERGPDFTRRLLDPHGALLSAYEPALLHVPGFDDLPVHAAPDGEEGRKQVFRSITALLVAASRERPVVLAVDDVQWADDLTVGALTWLSRCGIDNRL